MCSATTSRIPRCSSQVHRGLVSRSSLGRCGGLSFTPGSRAGAALSAALRFRCAEVEGYGELMDDWLQSRTNQINQDRDIDFRSGVPILQSCYSSRNRMPLKWLSCTTEGGLKRHVNAPKGLQRSWSFFRFHLLRIPRVGACGRFVSVPWQEFLQRGTAVLGSNFSELVSRLRQIFRWPHAHVIRHGWWCIAGIGPL